LPPERPAYDTFLSYSRKDSALAGEIHRALEEEKLRVFRDTVDIGGGAPFVNDLEHALESSRTVVFLVSRSSVESRWVDEERRFALYLANSKPNGPTLIPVLLDNAWPPGFLATRNVVDFRTDEAFPQKMQRLVAAVRGGPLPAPIAEPPAADIGWLSFFPEGLLETLYDKLVRLKHLEDASSRSERLGTIVRIDSHEVDLVGFDPARVGIITDVSAEVRRLLDALEACFAEEDPFIDDYALGRGRALLLRDMLGLMVLLGDAPAESRRQERMRNLARVLLPRVAEEGEIRIAFEMSTHLLSQVFSPSVSDYLLHANLLLRLDQPRQAFDLFELYRAQSDLFGEAGLGDKDRIRCVLDWARAAKATGQGRRLHHSIVEACGKMIDLAERLLATGDGG